MGVGSSHTGNQDNNMSSSDQEDSPHFLRSSAVHEQEEDSDLSSIVAYLIRSGHIHFISHSNGESDSDSSSDSEFVAPAQPPPADPNPDTKKLQKNDVVSYVMRSSGRWPNKSWLQRMAPVIPNMVMKRQLGMNEQKQFTHGDQCLLGSRFLPNRVEKLCSYKHKAFCGTYSKDGNYFLSASQDHHLRVYDTSEDEFRLVKSIRARDVGWSVLDTAFSPDGRFAAYSSWSDCIHLCNIFGDHDTHEALHLDPGDHSFCIFSLMFSSDNQEILGGANDGHLYVYDRESKKRTLKINAHDDDVNAVRFADDSSQILFSGGDDGLCKVWDRRTLREERPLPVGILAGHSDGVTYIDSKGDARFFISNSKDQTMKLWDVRCFSDQAGVEETKKVISSQRWDYRWQQVPRKVTKVRHLKGDTSIMTYRGHSILQTLIRCKFSPEASTGQRFIYSGCASGRLLVYDVLTGKVVRCLTGHSLCVRDVSWHPYKNNIISTSWDGTLGKWTFFDHNAHDIDPGEETLEKDDCPRVLRSSKHPRVRGPKEASITGLFD